MDANKKRVQSPSLNANDHKSTPTTTSNSTSRSSGNSDSSSKKRPRPDGFAGSSLSASTEDESKSHANETILVPRYRDILLGRGRGIQTSNGNYLMREIIRKYRAEYTAAPRSQRREISERVLDEILATGARFLRRIETNTGRELWQEVDRPLAHEKVSHALREKKYTGATTNDEEESSSWLTTRNPVESQQSRSPSTDGQNTLQHDQQTTSAIPLESQHPYSSLPPDFTSQPPPSPSLLTTQQSGGGSASRILLPYQSQSDAFQNNVTTTPTSFGGLLTHLQGLQSNSPQHQQTGTSSPYLLNNYMPSSVAAGIVLESLIHQHTTNIAATSQNLLAGAFAGIHHQAGLLGGDTRRGGSLTGSGGNAFPIAAAPVQQLPQATTPSPATLAFLLANNSTLLPPVVVQALQQELAHLQHGLNDLQSASGSNLISLMQNNMIPPRHVLEQGPPEAGSRITFVTHGAQVHHSNSAGANARELSNPAFPPSLRDSSNFSFSAGEAASSMNDDDESTEQNNSEKN